MTANFATAPVGEASLSTARRNILLLVEYDGTDFCGWQQQAPGQRTVQAALRAAVHSMTGEDPTLRASSRTDSGVHSLGLPVSFTTATTIRRIGLLRGLNTRLPGDASVRAVYDVPLDFDARKSSRGKRYRYDVWNAGWRSASRGRTSWWVKGKPLDRTAMHAAGQWLLGEQDFSSFRAAHCDSLSVRRTLTRVDVTEPEPHLVRITVEGDAFLRNMVRIIAGTLVDVGHGRRRPQDLVTLLAARDRNLAGMTAPAHGLTLAHVFYELPPGVEGFGDVVGSESPGTPF